MASLGITAATCITCSALAVHYLCKGMSEVDQMHSNSTATTSPSDATALHATEVRFWGCVGGAVASAVAGCVLDCLLYRREEALCDEDHGCLCCGAVCCCCAALCS